jgi:opacity protein-like surface antigen
MKIVLRVSSFIIASFLSFHSFATTGSGWIMVEAGAAFSTTQDETNTMALPNDAPPAFLYDDYKTSDRDNGYLIGLSGGYEFEVEQEQLEELLPKIRIGIGYEYVGKTEISGQVHLYQEQPYYDYNFDTFSNVAWAIGQLDLPSFWDLTPFIDLGLGLSFNHAGEYEEARINDEVHVRESADFDSNTETEFAWRVGLGINYQGDENSNWKIGALVRYSDLGDAQTGDSKTYPTVESLSLPINNIEAVLQLGYYF